MAVECVKTPAEPVGRQDFMMCPVCAAHDPWPPTRSDDGTTTCRKCGSRFPITE